MILRSQTVDPWGYSIDHQCNVIADIRSERKFQAMGPIGRFGSGANRRLTEPATVPPLSVDTRRVQNAAVRSILLRTGMLRLYCQTEGKPEFRIALVDGPVDTKHPSIATSTVIPLWGHKEVDPKSPVVQHATFIASILVGRATGVVGICPGCTLISVPAVDDEMISGALHPRTIAERLAKAVLDALSCGADVIQLSLEFAGGTNHFFRLLSDALSEAARQGVRTVMPSGNIPTLAPRSILSSQGVVPVVMADWDGLPHHQAAGGVVVAQRGLLAHGVDIPGACSPAGYTIRSGSSFAAAFVTGASALLAALAPRQSREELWGALLRIPSASTQASWLFPMYLDVEASFKHLKQTLEGENYEY
jgi:subtilisin family serine protease